MRFAQNSLFCSSVFAGRLLLDNRPTFFVFLSVCKEIKEREWDGDLHFYLGLNPSVSQRGFKGFPIPLFLIAIPRSKACFAEISAD